MSRSIGLRGARSTVVFGPEQSIEDEPIEVKFKNSAFHVLKLIVKARETVETCCTKSKP